MVLILGLFEHVLIENNDGVGSQHDFVLPFPGRFGLFASEAPNIAFG
jgi:hypothetical protein